MEFTAIKLLNFILLPANSQIKHTLGNPVLNLPDYIKEYGQ